jgi:hypothetical protein
VVPDAISPDMKRGFAVIGIIGGLFAAVIVLYAISFVWIFPRLHDQTLSKFSSELTNIPVPQKTQLIDTISEVGQQSGNSDHCDYLGALLLKTDLSKSDAEKYYRDSYRGTSQLHFYWTDEPHQPGIGAVRLSMQLGGIGSGTTKPIWRQVGS